MEDGSWDELAPIAEAAGFEHHACAGVALLSRTPLVDPRQVSLNSGRSFVHARSEIGGVTFSPASANAPPMTCAGRQAPQPIDLSGWAAAIDERTCCLLAAGAMATGYTLLTDESHASNMARPYDEGEVILEGLDGPEGRLLARKSSGRRDTLGWHPFAVSLPLPAGARAARLTWLSHHKVYNGASNDAVFDDLYLGIDCGADPHATLGPNLLQNPGAERDDAHAWQPGCWQVLPDMETMVYHP